MSNTTPVEIIVEQLELIAMHFTGQSYQRKSAMKTVEQTQQLTLSAADVRLLFPAIEQAAYLAAGRGDIQASRRLWDIFHALERMQFYRVSELSGEKDTVADETDAGILSAHQMRQLRAL